MPQPTTNNKHYLLRLWMPALLGCAFVGALVIPALLSDDPARRFPVMIGLVVAAVLIVAKRSSSKRAMRKLLQSADPNPSLRSLVAPLRRMPNGAHFAAASSATILALYGRVAEAERALDAVSWQDVPPIVQGQALAARSLIAYVQGLVLDGLEYAVAGAQQAAVGSAVPGDAISELAFRTYRNLGLALSGRATATTAEEFRAAFERLPLVGQIVAAWGLALLAKQHDDSSELLTMRQFLIANGPHLVPVLESTGAR